MIQIKEVEVMKRWAKRIKDIEDRMIEEEYKRYINEQMFEKGLL